MARSKLTAGRIAAFRCPEASPQVFKWDSEAPGLAVRATPGDGPKAFIFQGRLNGKALRITIGDTRSWDIDRSDPEHPGARQEARRLQALIDRGIDPRMQRAELDAANEMKRQAAKRTEAPASEAWAAYLESHRAKWSARTLKDHLYAAKPGGDSRTRGRRKSDPAATKPGALASLLALPLGQITDDRVRDWLRSEVASRPTQAALSFRILRAFLRWCSRQPLFRDQAHKDACPASLSKDELPKRSAKQDSLERGQLAEWFKAVRAIPNPTISAYLQIALLIGSRREELAALKWSDVDFRWNKLHIADKIEEAGRAVPLTPYVASLLRELKRRNETPPKVRKLRPDDGGKSPEWAPSPWVFASPTAKSGRIEEPRIAHVRALQVAGISGLTIHGLRRSFGSLADGWCDVPLGVVAQIQGHKPSALVEKHYRQRPLDLLREWHIKIENWILAEAGIEVPADEQRTTPALVAAA